MTVGRAKWGCLGLVVWVLWSVGGVGLAEELSDSALAKQYQRLATKALKAKDHQGAIRALKQLEKVTSERRWEFLYVYGTLLVEYGTTAAEVEKGKNWLVKAVNKIEKMGKEEDPYYQRYFWAAFDRLDDLKKKEEAAFARADSAGTAAAYAEYLAAYPQGRYAGAAEEKRKKRAAEEKKKAEEKEARRAEEEAAFARADSAGTAAAYAEYLAAYPQGRYAGAAEEKRKKRAAEEKKKAEEKEARRAEEEAAFARADSAGTAAAYAEYLAAYPQGRYAGVAEEKRKKRAAEEKKKAEEARRAEEEAAFARADSAGTAAAYAEYLAAYPQGRYAGAAEEKRKKRAAEEKKRAEEARRAEEEAAFARADSAGTAAAYAEYLAAYPQGRYAGAAEEKRKKRAAEEKKRAEEARRAEEEAAFARADSAGTAAAYAEYLTAYHQGRYAGVAEEKRKKRAAEEKKRAEEARRAEEEAAFARADSAGTAAAYAEYLAAYPRGRHAEEAEEKKKVIEAARLKELLGEMVHVPGGTFRMGCTAEQGYYCSDDEKPVHEVQVSDFEIGQYEVTQVVWEAVMGENPSEFEGCLQCPVENVDWDDVQEFIERLNDSLGEEYRLPTEAEWEYAARGGQRQSIFFWSEGYKYAGSDEPDAIAWYRDNSGRKTHPVGQKQPNELGLYDMSGNVWEWTQDCWNLDYRGAPADGGAWEERFGCLVHVLRGGSWLNDPGNLRSANRYRHTVGYRGYNVGFRLARTLTP